MEFSIKKREGVKILKTQIQYVSIFYWLRFYRRISLFDFVENTRVLHHRVSRQYWVTFYGSKEFSCRSSTRSCQIEDQSFSFDKVYLSLRSKVYLPVLLRSLIDVVGFQGLFQFLHLLTFIELPSMNKEIHKKNQE